MLVLLSVSGAGIASTDANAVLIATGVSLVMAIKLRLVCTYFLELHEAHPRIRRAVVVVDGGELLIDWRSEDDRVFMTGPVVTTAGRGERTLRKRAALRVWW